jgi:poly-gamma-glutamate synthesis protein (capsule biosynthesis protein)
MKRFTIIITLLVAALIFFSFLSRTDLSKEEPITLFFDLNMSGRSLIEKEFKAMIKDHTGKLFVNYFEPSEINKFIISNPDALFVSDNAIQSELYSLERQEYSIAKVAVTNYSNVQDVISNEEFDNLLLTEFKKDEDIAKKVIKNKLPYGIISYENLNSRLKPLKIDGVFPSLRNIKNGRYKGVYKGFVYVKKHSHDAGTHTLIENGVLSESFGEWLHGTFSIIAGGDIMLARGTNRYIKLFGPRYPFIEISDEIKLHDIAFANLESPISNRGKKYSPNKGIYFRADPSVIDGLLYAGFDVLSLANNHVFDWGMDAISDTMDLLSRNGFRFSGVGSSRPEALRPAVIQINDKRIAFISYNDIFPFSITDSGHTMVVPSVRNSDVEKEISFLNENYDVIIVSLHTGREYIPEPETEKVELMRRLVDYGADVVLGTHPHVIQGIEAYRDGIIAYSLGNLIFDQDWSEETSRGLLLEIAFHEDKPLYYYPRIVVIKDTRAFIMEDEPADTLLAHFTLPRESHEKLKY